MACTAIYLVELIVPRVFGISLAWVDEWLALIPVAVMKGEIWQLVTYSFLHVTFRPPFLQHADVWFIGAYLEGDWGPRRFIECYTFCVVGAALVTIAMSYTHFLGMNELGKTEVGASGGIFGLLMAFGILYADQEMFLVPAAFPHQSEVPGRNLGDRRDRCCIRSKARRSCGLRAS